MNLFSADNYILKRNLFIVCFFGVVIFSGFSCIKINAQQILPDTESSATPVSSPVPALSPSPTPIPISSIIIEKEKSERRIQEINSTFSDQKPVLRIQSDISTFLKDFDQREQESNSLLGSTPSLESIDKNETYWNSISLTLPSRKSRIQTKALEISEQVTELQTMLSVWQLTESSIKDDPSITSIENNSANDQNASLNLKEQITELIESIKQTQIMVQAKLGEVINLQEEISDAENRTDSMLKKIAVARAILLSDLVVRDSPPIWSSSSISTAFRSDVENSFAYRFSELRSYFFANYGLFLLHLLIILALILLFHHSNLKMKKLVEDEPMLKNGLVIFEHPYSSALLVGLFIGPFLYWEAPELLGLIASPLLVVAIFLLFRNLVEKVHLPILIAVVVLYLVNDIRLLTAPIAFLTRSIFIIEMLAGILFLAWLISVSRESNNEEITPRPKTIRYVAIFLLIPFLVALFANVFGFVALAGVVGKAIVTSLSVGLILFALVKVTESLIIFLFRIPPFSSLGMVRNYRPLVQKTIFKIIKWLAVIGWFVIAISQAYLLDPFVDILQKLFTTEFGTKTIKVSLSSIISLILIIWFSFLLSRFIRFVLDQDIYPRVNLASGLPYATSTILHYLILLGGFVLALAAAGLDLSKFTIFLGALGVGVGIGLQNIVENFTSGMILLLERPVKVGDSIQMEEKQGILKQIGLRASIVKTFEGAEIIVPNGQLITEEVTNWTRSDERRRLDINVGVEYGADVEQVLSLLEQVGAAHPEADKIHKPRALFIEFGDSSLNFQLRVWTSNTDEWVVVKSDISVGVYKKLKEAGIEIPFPQCDLHIKSIDSNLIAGLDQLRARKNNKNLDD